ncbi:MAG: hypothetical protein ACLUFT_12355 [Gemmiger formicilis]|uniref:hypothetical protein n=1 Tax=Gemmiger formicilis TaxID=745368 RepID=UPI0039916721
MSILNPTASRWGATRLSATVTGAKKATPRRQQCDLCVTCAAARMDYTVAGGRAVFAGTCAYWN